MRIQTLVCVLGALVAYAAAEQQLTMCQGVWGPDDIPNARMTAAVEVFFSPVAPAGSIAVAVYNFLDMNFVARDPLMGLAIVCSQFDVVAGACNQSELGKFHIQPLTGMTQLSPILNERIFWLPFNKTASLKANQRLQRRQVSPTSSTAAPRSTGSIASASPTSAQAIATTLSASKTATSSASPSPTQTTPSQNSSLAVRYEVKGSGMYCVLVSSQLFDSQDYSVKITITNPYGLLPATFYPALVFYGTMSMCYLIVGIIWMGLSYRSWRDLLPIQHFVSGVIAFLILEMAFNYGLYEDYNETGRLSTTLLALTVTFNAGRISISFFMLLIVSLGYGVVRPTLGDTMKRCIFLTILHFIFGVSYSAMSITSRDQTSLLLFFLAIPLSLTMTAFYTWIFTGLTETMQRLELRRQSVKLLMYQRLWYILSASAVGLMLIIVANSINLSHRGDPQWIAKQWKWRWMLLDGSMNLVYFFVFVSISILWRPTDNNQRYGLDQLAQDDPDNDPLGIKLHDVGERFDDEELEEFEAEFGGHSVDVNETADDVLRWVEQNVGGASTHAAATGGSSSSEHARLVAASSQESSGVRSRPHPHTQARMDTNEQLNADADAMRPSASSDRLI